MSELTVSVAAAMELVQPICPACGAMLARPRKHRH